MFVLNGKKFAKNKAEVVQTLFERGTTAVGYYRENKPGILLMDLNRNPVAFIRIATSHECIYNEVFAVTATKDEETRAIRYLCGGLTEAGEKFLGLDGMGYGESRDVIEHSVKMFHATTDSKYKLKGYNYNEYLNQKQIS